MPEIIVELAEGRTLDQKRALVRGITAVVVETCVVQPEQVTVIIHETSRINKAKGGVLFADR